MMPPNSPQSEWGLLQATKSWAESLPRLVNIIKGGLVRVYYTVNAGLRQRSGRRKEINNKLPFRIRTHCIMSGKSNTLNVFCLLALTGIDQFRKPDVITCNYSLARNTREWPPRRSTKMSTKFSSLTLQRLLVLQLFIVICMDPASLAGQLYLFISFFFFLVSGRKHI